MLQRLEYLGGGYFLTRTDTPVYPVPRFSVKNTDKTLLFINLGYPDSFALTWESSLSADEFLKAACTLIDELSGKSYHYRPIETGNPVAVVSIPISGGSAHLKAEPSYSDFGYNNLRIHPLYGELRFDQLQWPLTLQNIYNWYLEDGLSKEKLPQNNDEIWIRINAEFCTLFYGDSDEKWHPRRFSYWSHIPALQELLKTHQETAIRPIPQNIFTKALEKTIGPVFPIEY